MRNKDSKTPGEILKEEFLKPLGIMDDEFALDPNILDVGVSAVLYQGRAISVDFAMRLSIYFGTTPQFWLNLQSNYDMQKIKENRPDWMDTVKTCKWKKVVV